MNKHDGTTAGIFDCRRRSTQTIQKFSYIRVNGQGRENTSATKIYLRTVRHSAPASSPYQTITDKSC